MESKFFTCIKPFLSYIDNGTFFRQPFKWLYIVFAVLNLLFPLYILYQAISSQIFSVLPAKFIVVFIVVFLILALAAWISFQLWWDRKDKVIASTAEGDRFIVTPVFSHFIQTLGEWMGIWIAIVGSLLSLIITLVLGEEGSLFSRSMGLSFISIGYISVIMMPIYGFLIVVLSRFFAEQFRAITVIANNTTKQ